MLFFSDDIAISNAVDSEADIILKSVQRDLTPVSIDRPIGTYMLMHSAFYTIHCKHETDLDQENRSLRLYTYIHIIQKTPSNMTCHMTV